MGSYPQRGTARDPDLRSWEKRETIPSATLLPPEWFCIKMGCSARHFNVSFIVRGQTVSLHIYRYSGSVLVFKVLAFDQYFNVRRIQTGGVCIWVGVHGSLSLSLCVCVCVWVCVFHDFVLLRSYLQLCFWLCFNVLNQTTTLISCQDE